MGCQVKPWPLPCAVCSGCSFLSASSFIHKSFQRTAGLLADVSTSPHLPVFLLLLCDCFKPFQEGGSLALDSALPQTPSSFHVQSDSFLFQPVSPSAWAQDSAAPRCFSHKLFTPYCIPTADHSCLCRGGTCTFSFLSCVSFFQALSPDHLSSTLPFWDTLALEPRFETFVFLYPALHTAH